MDAVALQHVEKSYTSYSSEIVITGQTRQSRTRQVLRDLSVRCPIGQLTVIVGRSGCGKSSATNFLREKGYPCIDADLVAREVLLPGSPCIAQLQQVFGADIADENGTVRRRLLADRAFATPEGKAALDGLTHPEIVRRIRAAKQAAQEAGAAVTIRQSNYEGELVTWVQQAHGVFDGLVINAAAYTHTSVALLDALKAVRLPAAEVHLTDIDAREPFRRISYVGMACGAHFKGLGFEGYRRAIRWLCGL